MPGQAVQDEIDRRFMAASIRLSRRHLGLTSTNPSVGTLIVRDSVIIGRGVTAIGGRPHAEPLALVEAGALAQGATAYVTLEPCAHHGRTPPCAEALILAGVRRVVGAASDPDPRVSGRGYDMLRAAGVEVVESVLRDEAADLMAGYLVRSLEKRPEVTLKLAVSRDGKIGIRSKGHIAITGEAARRQVHMMRAETDAILVGIGTALADDPELTVRLPGLNNRSPARIVLDIHARLEVNSKLAGTANKVPVWVAAGPQADPERKARLKAAGVRFIATELYRNRIALPELLEDLASQGISTLMVEGGAETAQYFLAEGLVDRICLFTGACEIGPDGIASPISPASIPCGYRQVREAVFGDDGFAEWVRAH